MVTDLIIWYASLLSLQFYIKKIFDVNQIYSSWSFLHSSLFISLLNTTDYSGIMIRTKYYVDLEAWVVNGVNRSTYDLGLQV